MKKRTYIQGLKIYNLTKLLWELSFRFNLTLTILYKITGWFKEIIYFEIEGQEEKIKQFQKFLQDKGD